MLEYYNLYDKHIDSIKKLSSNKHEKWNNYLKIINANECKSDMERQLLLATKRNTKEFVEAYSEIQNTPSFIESDNLCKQMIDASGKYVEAMIKIDAHFKKNWFGWKVPQKLD